MTRVSISLCLLLGGLLGPFGRYSEALSSEAKANSGAPLSLLNKSQRIPWSNAFEQRSHHFTIITNTSKKLAGQISQALEQQYKDFVFRFQVRKAPKQPLPVKIFAERAEFKKYTSVNANKGTSERAAGYFDPNRVEIVLFWSDDPEDVLQTLYHEVTHYFVSLYMGPRAYAPMWLDEGLAVYFEASLFKDGRLETGRIPHGRLLELQEAIKAGKHHPLRKLMGMKDYGPGGYDLLGYAEGWSVVYFFAKSAGGHNAKNFGRYMDEIKKGRRHQDAFKKAFNATPEQLEAAWKPFVMGLGMKSAEGWYERGLHHYYQQHFEEAVEACDKAIKIDPKHAKAFLIKGHSHFWLNKVSEAYEALKTSTDLDPKQPRAFYFLARTMERLKAAGDKRGNEHAQEQAYLKAIQLRPDYAEALGLLAWLYAIAQDPKLNKIKDAIPIAQRAVELDPTADMLDTLAECYHQNGQHQQAIEASKKALAAKPENREYFVSQLKKFQAALKKRR